LDVEPPVFPRFVQLERALRWAHGICILEISLGAVNLVTFWATYWWTIVFSVLCFVVGTTGALNFRGVYDLAGTSLCFRTRSLVPVVLYGQLCITVMGVLASITAIIAAANAKKGSVDKAFATFSAVVSALLVIIAVAGTYWIRAVRKWMKPRQRVVYVPYPCPPTQVVADAAPYPERQHFCRNYNNRDRWRTPSLCEAAHATTTTTMVEFHLQPIRTTCWWHVTATRIKATSAIPSESPVTWCPTAQRDSRTTCRQVNSLRVCPRALHPTAGSRRTEAVAWRTQWHTSTATMVHLRRHVMRPSTDASTASPSPRYQSTARMPLRRTGNR
jgi:hypothetical protein